MGFFTSSSSPVSLDATGKFSSDLAHHAKEHTEFLRAMHVKGISLQDPPSAESLRRYRDLWLPLVQQNPQAALIPPDDIAWLWHCHRLAPKSYQQYLRSEFGPEAPTLEAKPCFAFQSKDSNGHAPVEAQQALQLWNAKYPKEDFFLSRKSKRKMTKKTKGTKLNGFDLLGSCKRQAKFLWQVSGPRYSDPSFLQQGVQNYYQFLKLRTHAPEQILVPTLQIDLLWHTHILIGIDNYNRDCMAIMNSEFHHDDSIEDAQLEDYFKATSKLWKTHYHQEYYVDGGMDRGTPPKEYWKPEWAKQNHSVARSTVSNSASSNIVWVWKETSSQLSNHPPSQVILGGWVHYNQASSGKLETAFQNQQGQGTCAPMDGYIVNFATLKQTKVSTGFERDVQRMEMVWCWEETQPNMSNHSADAIFGDRADRMIKYTVPATLGLETAYQAQGGTGTFSPLPGYEVDFAKMVQTKTATGFQRTVQRVPVAKNMYDGQPKAPPESAIIENTKPKTASSGMVYQPPAQVASNALVHNPADSSATAPSESKQCCTPKVALLVGIIFCILLAVVATFAVMNMMGGEDDDFDRSPSTALYTPSPTSSLRVPSESPSWTPVGNHTPVGSPTYTPAGYPSQAPIGFSTANKRYLCGSAPRENSIRSVPTCLRVTPLYNGGVWRQPSRPLCLSGNEPESLPPMWCYSDYTAPRSSYHLWWSPCTTCGTAWRLDEQRDDDKSMFKRPYANPGNDEMPPMDNWQTWSTSSSSWQYDTVMNLVPCDPQECWVDASSSGSYSGSGTTGDHDGMSPILAILFVLIIAGSVACLMMCMCSKNKKCCGGSGRHGGSGCSGGGCGGGGGGCGGGGGGGGCGGGGCGGC